MTNVRRQKLLLNPETRQEYLDSIAKRASESKTDEQAHEAVESPSEGN